MYYNKIVIVGELFNEPETHATKSGEVVKFKVETKKNVKSRDDKEYEFKDFFNVVCFGKLGEAVKENLHKGKLVLVEGEFAHKTYKKDDVETKYTEIVAKEISWVKVPVFGDTTYLKQEKMPLENKVEEQTEIAINELPF